MSGVSIKTVPSWQRAIAVKKELGLTPVGVGCFVVIDGKFLLLLRAGAHGPDTWCPPGGWVDGGENPLQTVEREVWEEVGLTIEAPVFRGYSFTRHAEGVDVVTLWFRTESWRGYPRAAYPAKVKEIRWCSEDDLPFPLFDGVSEAIMRGFASGE